MSNGEGDWDRGIVPMVTLMSIGRPVLCCQKGGADLTGIMINIMLRIPLNPNKKTQCVTKGTVNTLNAAIKLPKSSSQSTGLEGAVCSECLFRHIN